MTWSNSTPDFGGLSFRHAANLWPTRSGPRRSAWGRQDRTPDGGGLVPRRVCRALGTAQRGRIQAAQSQIVPGIFAARRKSFVCPAQAQKKTAAEAVTVWRSANGDRRLKRPQARPAASG